MEEPRPGTTRMTGNLGSAGRGPGVIAVVIVTFLGVALVKPWGSVGEHSPVRPAALEPTAQPSGPAPTVDPLAALRLHCQEPLGWRTYSRERWSGGIVRSWRSVAPITDASGPLDGRIPVVPLGATVEAMGYCSPWRSPERPPDDARTTVWQTDPTSTGGSGSIVPMDLERFAGFPASPLGVLFAAPRRAPAPGAAPASAPASAAAPVADTWPPGRYVVAVRGAGFSRWWAVQIDPPVDR